MSTVTPPRLMTAAEFLALPEDGTDRWLIRGQLREQSMTYRNRQHSRITARVAQYLANWLDAQAPPRGAVLAGEAGCRLREDPDTIVGIDVVYLSPRLAAQEPADTTIVPGAPTLAVEVLSPSDREEDINEKVDAYRQAGVPLVWLIDPHLRTVQVMRPDGEPELFNIRQELTAEPHLPGFRVPVARLFE